MGNNIERQLKSIDYTLGCGFALLIFILLGIFVTSINIYRSLDSIQYKIMGDRIHEIMEKEKSK
jgi:hypothetical protein